MANFAPSLMGSSSSIMVTTSSFQELVALITSCTCELF